MYWPHFYFTSVNYRHSCFSRKCESKYPHMDFVLEWFCLIAADSQTIWTYGCFVSWQVNFQKRRKAKGFETVISWWKIVGRSTKWVNIFLFSRSFFTALMWHKPFCDTKRVWVVEWWECATLHAKKNFHTMAADESWLFIQKSTNNRYNLFLPFWINALSYKEVSKQSYNILMLQV